MNNLLWNKYAFYHEIRIMENENAFYYVCSYQKMFADTWDNDNFGRLRHSVG